MVKEHNVLPCEPTSNIASMNVSIARWRSSITPRLLSVVRWKGWSLRVYTLLRGRAGEGWWLPEVEKAQEHHMNQTLRFPCSRKCWHIHKWADHLLHLQFLGRRRHHFSGRNRQQWRLAIGRQLLHSRSSSCWLMELNYPHRLLHNIGISTLWSWSNWRIFSSYQKIQRISERLRVHPCSKLTYSFRNLGNPLHMLRLSTMWCTSSYQQPTVSQTLIVLEA